jgi:hypothetical protein
MRAGVADGVDGGGGAPQMGFLPLFLRTHSIRFSLIPTRTLLLLLDLDHFPHLVPPLMSPLFPSLGFLPSSLLLKPEAE